jgi:site-specific DNA-adenine methylase
MRYPGGKGKCYQRLINLMPVHETYIETHLGGGAVMRNKRPAARNIGIDIDQQVIDVWRGGDIPANSFRMTL